MHGDGIQLHLINKQQQLTVDCEDQSRIFKEMFGLLIKNHRSSMAVFLAKRQWTSYLVPRFWKYENLRKLSEKWGAQPRGEEAKKKSRQYVQMVWSSWRLTNDGWMRINTNAVPRGTPSSNKVAYKFSSGWVSLRPFLPCRAHQTSHASIVIRCWAQEWWSGTAKQKRRRTSKMPVSSLHVRGFHLLQLTIQFPYLLLEINTRQV